MSTTHPRRTIAHAIIGESGEDEDILGFVQGAFPGAFIKKIAVDIKEALNKAGYTKGYVKYTAYRECDTFVMSIDLNKAYYADFGYSSTQAMIDAHADKVVRVVDPILVKSGKRVRWSKPWWDTKLDDETMEVLFTSFGISAECIKHYDPNTEYHTALIELGD